MRTRARWLASLLLGLPAIAAANDPAEASAKARAPEGEVDAELLEFLGSVDDLGAGWTEYLTQTDIAKLVRTTRDSPAKDETND